MKIRTQFDSTIPEVAMQKLSFPPIRSGLHVTMAQKEPPERSWSKYKKVLIDNPKDSDLLQRQKLWNFQKLNRGAFRSQIASLPDIPYRHTSAIEKISVGSQVDFTQRFSRSLRVIFPNLTNRRSSFVPSCSDDLDSDDSSRNKACSPMHQEISDLDEYSDDFDDDVIEIDDNDLTVDEVIRKHNAGTMTDFLTSDNQFKRQHRKRKPARDKNPYTQKNSILSGRNSSLPPINKKKNVKFNSENELPDLNFNGVTPSMDQDTPEVTPEPEVDKTIVPQLPIVDIKEREIERESTGDEILFPVENIGHSSHLALDSVSILDFISGNLTDRSRASDRGRTKDPNSVAPKRRSKLYSDPEADRIWFEKLVGDKELIDSETYESFARSRPSNEAQYFPEKIVETNKPTPRKNFTPRINDEFPAYHSVLSKSTTSKNTNTSNSLTVTINKGGKTQKRPPVNIGKFY